MRTASSASARAAASPGSGAASFSGQEPADGEDAPVRRDGRTVLELLERLTHRTDQRQTGTLVAKSGFAFSRPSVLSRKTFASSSTSKITSGRMPATEKPRAFSAASPRATASSRVTLKSIEASGKAREKPARPTAAPTGDHGEAGRDEDAVPPVEPDGGAGRGRAHPAALRAAGRRRESSQASRSSLPSRRPS